MGFPVGKRWDGSDGRNYPSDGWEVKRELPKFDQALADQRAKENKERRKTDDTSRV